MRTRAACGVAKLDGPSWCCLKVTREGGPCRFEGPRALHTQICTHTHTTHKAPNTEVEAHAGAERPPLRGSAAATPTCRRACNARAYARHHARTCRVHAVWGQRQHARQHPKELRPHCRRLCSCALAFLLIPQAAHSVHPGHPAPPKKHAQRARGGVRPRVGDHAVRGMGARGKQARQQTGRGGTQPCVSVARDA